MPLYLKDHKERENNMLKLEWYAIVMFTVKVLKYLEQGGVYRKPSTPAPNHPSPMLALDFNAAPDERIALLAAQRTSLPTQQEMLHRPVPYCVPATAAPLGLQPSLVARDFMELGASHRKEFDVNDWDKLRSQELLERQKYPQCKHRFYLRAPIENSTVYPTTRPRNVNDDDSTLLTMEDDLYEDFGQALQDNVSPQVG